MKKILPDICAIIGGLQIGTNISQLNTVEGCISVLFGAILVVVGLRMASKMK